MASGLIQQVQIDNDNVREVASIASTAFGICSSTANTVSKTVTIPGFTLIAGTTIYIQFTHNNTATSPTLNVSSTGALPIKLPNGDASGTIDESTGWYAGAVVMLTYDGSNWIRNQGYNTNNFVAQLSTSYNLEYPLIFKYTSNTDNETAQVRYNGNVTINPSTGVLTALGFSGSGANLTDIPFDGLVIPNNSITNDMLVNSGITVANRLWSLGDTISASTLISDLGLSNAMHFIGVVASNSTNTPSDGQNAIPTISDVVGYTPVAGDVVIDSANSREYVYTSGNTWELLGQDASTTIDSNLFYYSSNSTDEDTIDIINPATPTSSNNIWISRIQQLSDRTLVLHKTTLNTSGEWTGNAATATALETARTILVNLESTTASSFDGSANITPGVSGILPIAHGGTNTNAIPTIGGIIYGGGTLDHEAYACSSAGNAGEVLISTGAAEPLWNGGLLLTGTSAATYVASFTGTTDASATNIAAVKIAGGLGIEKKLYVGSTADIAGATTIHNEISSSTSGESSQLIVKNTTSINPGNVAIELVRGATVNTSYASWQISVEDGDLHFKSNYLADGSALSTAYNYDAFSLIRNTGSATFAGSVTATTYYGAIESIAQSDDVNRHIWFGRTSNSNELLGVLAHDNDFEYNPSTNVLIVGALTITGGTTNSSVSSSGTLTIDNSTQALTVSTTTAALTISSTNGTMTIGPTGTGTLTISTNSGGMSIQTTSGNMTLASGGTVSISSETSKTTTINSGSTLILNSATGTAIEFQKNSTTAWLFSEDGTNLSPATTNTINLGIAGGGNNSTARRWKTLYLGTDDSYGDAYTPVYWNNGVPSISYPVQYFTWTINNGNKGVSLSHTSFTEDTFPITIMITSGEQHLNGPISWTNGTGTFSLISDLATSGVVQGYCIVARGTSINPSATAVTSNT